MALPIAPTPILRGKDARDFEKKIKSDLQKPTALVPTPKLDAARALIQQYANGAKKLS
jgi:hypothetical protein